MNERVFKHTEAHKLEDPERLKWLPPAEVLSHLRLAPGMKVVDLGAGTGYFTMPIARVVGTLGTVYAVDLQPEMLALLKQKLTATGESGNVSLLQGTASSLPLPDHSVHVVFCANVWHELDNHDETFAEAQRVLIRGGKIVILDWRDDCFPPPGPPREHRMSAEAVTAYLEAKGCLEVVSRRVGDYAYLLTAQLSSPE